jgi:hypothetical protein
MFKALIIAVSISLNFSAMADTITCVVAAGNLQEPLIKKFDAQAIADSEQAPLLIYEFSGITYSLQVEDFEFPKIGGADAISIPAALTFVTNVNNAIFVSTGNSKNAVLADMRTNTTIACYRK